MVLFEERIKEYGFSHNKYLNIAKLQAKKNGYNPDLLIFSTKPKYKLDYDGIFFGDPEYFDYILYSLFEKKGLIDKGTAKERRKLYLQRATNIKGNWKNNKLSKNSLAISILW